MNSLICTYSASDLDEIESSSIDLMVRERLMLLDAVNDVLSRRVMDNYSDFVNGAYVHRHV